MENPGSCLNLHNLKVTEIEQILLLEWLPVKEITMGTKFQSSFANDVFALTFQREELCLHSSK